ncbi:MAG TPA: Mrp/NBP35 family ATP-binding protein [Pirellulaceae bacterium]|nr:Mrp/NBP35 family ATP-binding protein [Pirellulaceae bacterium]
MNSENQTITADEVRRLLSPLRDPETGRSLVSSGQIGDIVVDAQQIRVDIGLSTFASSLKADLGEQIGDLIQSQSGRELNVTVTWKTLERPPLARGTLDVRAKAVIAVGSGKGGVGKSTVALCLALALHRAGCRIGILDADVYGPSLPQLTGVHGPVGKRGDKIAPQDYLGMPLMSIGFLVPPDQAVIWRGPMLHSTMKTFLNDVDWGDLDYLIVDMPPGTGDVALSLSQFIPITGAVVVCTPQAVALIDAIKAVAMFRQVKIPVLGIVENMSGFLCPDNGKRYDIFGKGGAREYAEQAGVPFLGEIPIHIPLRERGDAGQTTQNFDDPQIAPYLERLAYQLARIIAQQAAQAPAKMELPVLR